MKVIAIPGRGFYAVVVDAEGAERPTLYAVDDVTVEQARRAYDIVLVEPLVRCIRSYPGMNATPPCPVALAGEGEPIRINGEEVSPATGGAYRALQHLVEVYPREVRRAALNRAAGVKDVSGPLGDLARADKRWSLVLQFPRAQSPLGGKTGTYAIVAPHTPPAAAEGEPAA